MATVDHLAMSHRRTTRDVDAVIHHEYRNTRQGSSHESDSAPQLSPYLQRQCTLTLQPSGASSGPEQCGSGGKDNRDEHQPKVGETSFE